jgi:alkylation response protein AidB-like acyl-CoA dehydrogenase/predicted heme/steroid binding protein
MKTFSTEEVSKHNKEDDLWLIIDGKVYDLTNFAAMHPGGESILFPFAGKDATKDFYALHKADVLDKYGPKYIIGTVEGQKSVVSSKPGDLSRVPYAEASAWQKYKSPYFKESHLRFKKAIRKFFDEVVLPEAKEFDIMGKYPSKEIFLKCGEFGYWASRIGPGPWLQGRKLPGGVKPEEFDYFHELIAHQELASMGFFGYQDGLACGMVIGLPPVLHFGSKELSTRIADEVLSGNKKICLSITEPFAGSDVASIQCTATKTPDGKHYIVNGVKKWITNGMFSDYFTTAVRTGGPGMGGISVLLIERSAGMRTKPIKVSYGGSAGTAYVIMENVKVPVENLLGKENEGFKVIMQNFNHERLLIVQQSVRSSRLVVEECFKWAMQRKVFNKPLIAQPVIRSKLAMMISQVEAVEAWLENITYQMCNMTYQEQSALLAGPIALLKLLSTKVGSYVSDNAVQIFGGRSLTLTGMGGVIERYMSGSKFASILGGAEDVMADLGVKFAMRYFPKNAKL